MVRIYAIILLISIIILGLFNIIYRLNKLEKEKELVVIYKNKLVGFLNSLQKGNFLDENLNYLNMKSYEIQITLGIFGIAETFIEPIKNVQYNNYQIIINGVNDIQSYARVGLTRDVIQIGLIMDSCLTKYLGYQDTEIKELKSYKKNPFICLREGIRVIVGFPIYFLYWTGLIQYSSYSKIKSNIVVRFIGVIVGIIGFISAVIGIITGYGPFMEIIKTKL